MSERILELAKKLKALAERGEGGEKVNAFDQLQKLIKKYDLNLEDFETAKLSYRVFAFDMHDETHKKFVRQVIISVIGLTDMYYNGLIHNNWAVEIDDLQYVEISEKIDFYWPIFKREMEIFYTAFVQKNDLTLNVPEGEMPTLSEAELQKLRQAFKMMQGMEKHEFKKLLNDKNEEIENK